MVEAATGMANPKPHVSTWPQSPTQCSLPKTGEEEEERKREEKRKEFSHYCDWRQHGVLSRTQAWAQILSFTKYYVARITSPVL